MARALVAALVLAVAVAACGGEPPPTATSHPATDAPTAVVTETATPSDTVSPSPSPSSSFSLGPGADVRLPGTTPTSFAGNVPATELDPAALAPAGAHVGSVWTAPEDAGVEAIAFAWTRGTDALAAESGFEVWTRFDDDPAWRAVYAFTDRPSAGVLGVSFEDGDLTGDGAPDALTFESTGGSGACGTWRVIRIERHDADEIFTKQTCDTDARIVGGALAMRKAVYGPDDPHCCPGAYRTTTLRWSETGWKVDRSTQRT